MGRYGSDLLIKFAAGCTTVSAIGSLSQVFSNGDLHS